jgi:hypothetical protein
LNIFLIANNENITNDTIDNLILKDEDIITLYNYQLPLKWDKIKNHNNKILFLRRNTKNSFHGEFLLPKNSYLFNKIILCTCLTKIEESCLSIDFDLQNYINLKYKINTEVFPKSKCDFGLYFPNGISPQTGLISYLYFKNNFNYENIYLIGFTNEYKNNWYAHSKDFEQNYYRSEIIKNYRSEIIKIDF